MLRRLALPTWRAMALITATAATTSPFAGVRLSSTEAAEPTPAAPQGSPASFTRPPQRIRQTPRQPLPPAFDVVHWNDADIAKGHLLRVVHRDSFILLEYFRQRRVLNEEGGNRAERVVTVTLPPVYIARLLGVLEGRLERVDIQSRFTNASFVPDIAQGKHCYALRCVSMRPTTGQQQSVDGSDLNEESIEWNVSFDAAESLMLQRFLSEALRYNSGFARRREHG